MGKLLVRQHHPAHPVEFRLGADVDQHRGRVGLKQRIGFLGAERAVVGELVLLLARLGCLQEFVSGRHG
ncbi:hypothetical protein DFLDMN_000420 [Cupriavidus sp. H19C3]